MEKSIKRMSGPTYVSDPRIWKTFYKNMVDGNFNPRIIKVDSQEVE